METRRLYYDDSYQREFSAQVLSCEPEAHGATPAWRVVLDCTAHVSDIGRAAAHLGNWAMPKTCLMCGMTARHRPRDRSRMPLALCTAAWIGGGAMITCSSTLAAFAFRDVSGALWRPDGFRFTSEMIFARSICAGRSRRKEILEGAERAANQVISETGRSMCGMARRSGSRVGCAQGSAARRIFARDEIEGADLQPCGGTHVKSTAQIGIILVRDCTKCGRTGAWNLCAAGAPARVSRHDSSFWHRAAKELGLRAGRCAGFGAARESANADSQFQGSECYCSELRKRCRGGAAICKAGRNGCVSSRARLTNEPA